MKPPNQALPLWTRQRYDEGKRCRYVVVALGMFQDADSGHMDGQVLVFAGNQWGKTSGVGLLPVRIEAPLTISP